MEDIPRKRQRPRRAASTLAQTKIKYEVSSDDENNSDTKDSLTDEDYQEESSCKTKLKVRKRKIKTEDSNGYESPAKRRRQKVQSSTKSSGKLIKTELEVDLKTENLDCEQTTSSEFNKIKADGPDSKINVKTESLDYETAGTSKKLQKIKFENEEKQLWDDYELLSELHDLDTGIATNVIKLFEEGNTIPFIARYRKDITDNMSPEKLRDLKDEYEGILALKARAQTVLKSIEKSGHLNPELKKSVLSARSIEEVEYIYAPYKPGGKRTLAERAKALGLEEPALVLLNNTGTVDLYKYLDQRNTELDSLDKIEKGVTHIIAYIIATDAEVLTFLRKLRTDGSFTVEAKKSSRKSEKTKSKTANGKPVDESKFENYFDFKIPVKYIKPHQVLAINRGEAQKVLTVKIVVPDYVFNRFSNFCSSKFINKGRFCMFRKKIMDESLKDSYSRLVQPLIVREIRSELKAKAEKASYEVFCNNLKQLLLETPMKGRPILGIDPGFSNGCKIALISSTGCLLDTFIVYPQKKGSERDAAVLKNMLKKYSCNLIVLGNGTACRETESWIVYLIQAGTFAPLDVTYTIVSENGASIYSCSPEAKKEFPVLDPNLISAVSLARRVQDPLAELVKVEPKHLGVGMYQHDLPKKQLEAALDEVVSECVSFVGVDLNTASQCLLRRTAGLSDKRATQIIEYREQNGTFRSRKDLLSVKGIGAKIFQQCAGFLRVGPLNAEDAINFYKNPDANKLDCTIIHPESYDVALKVIKSFNLSVNQIGESSFIAVVKHSKNSVDFQSLKTTEQTLHLIIDALCKPLDYDFRSMSQQTPLFRKSLSSLADLKVGTVLTGRISNVTHFGCFVDIGVGCDGLIHISKMKGQNLQIGNRVEITVVNIEVARKRIGLALNKVL